MKEEQALAKMIPPGQKRKGKREPGGVIQIWVTRACDKCCFGCTQGSNLKGNSGFMTPEQFEQAALSLKDYFGIVGVFGGNPCLSPFFADYCRILQKHIPKSRCGLWANKLFGHGAVCRETFSPRYSNLNVHLDRAAYVKMKQDWPESMPFGLDRDSRHSPPFVAMQDLVESEEARWAIIARCDINQNWSAMIGVFQGELRGWFCEIAGAQSILHQNDSDYPDTGVPIDPNWWRRPMSDFAEQARFHCHACGVPLRGHGELAMAENGTEQVTETHAAIYKPRKSDRRVEVVTELHQIKPRRSTFTRYLQNGEIVKHEGDHRRRRL